MVVGAGEVGGEDESEAAGGTRGGEVADFALAAGAEIAAACGPGVAGAEGLEGFDDAGGESHHEERALRFGCRVGCRVRRCGRGRCCGGHNELAIVLLIQGNIVD